jgi:hypothetical protein
MDIRSETVADFCDLAEQVYGAYPKASLDVVLFAGALLLIAREFKNYRAWAEEHHSR